MDEKKKYSIVSSVTIGTDEYRDLIEDAQRVKCDADRYMRQCWDKDSTIKELRGQIDKLKEKNKKLMALVGKEKTGNQDNKDFFAVFFSEE